MLVFQRRDPDEVASASSASDLDIMTGLDLSTDEFTFDLDNLDLNPQGQEVMTAHIKSPGLFYVHIISQQSGHTLDKLMKSLNGLFEKVNRRKLTKLSKTLDLEVGKLCCAQFTQDNNFYR